MALYYSLLLVMLMVEFPEVKVTARTLVLVSDQYQVGSRRDR